MKFIADRPLAGLAHAISSTDQTDPQGQAEGKEPLKKEAGDQREEEVVLPSLWGDARTNEGFSQGR